MPLKGNANIDIPIDGVGAQPDAVRRSRTDLSQTQEDLDPQISKAEMDLVNRHHAEVKASYRRAQKGE
ncbi:hypothetical protein [uncultured Gemmiger sp.]|uniref:hypothetical protein n=1 Tax=uncultured Gemmiger sp. TaxID=1623490 RepID=UPI0025D87F53|nr:hypothetical protein [uncultured Gemmiger sp.]